MRNHAGMVELHITVSGPHEDAMYEAWLIDTDDAVRAPTIEQALTALARTLGPSGAAPGDLPAP